jgi:hypothetical protein
MIYQWKLKVIYGVPGTGGGWGARCMVCLNDNNTATSHHEISRLLRPGRTRLYPDPASDLANMSLANHCSR